MVFRRRRASSKGIIRDADNSSRALREKTQARPSRWACLQLGSMYVAESVSLRSAGCIIKAGGQEIVKILFC